MSPANSKLLVSSTCFKVRVLLSFPAIGEKYHENLTYQEAANWFSFYVAACLEFPELSVRCVNLIKGKKSIKLFQNH